MFVLDSVVAVVLKRLLTWTNCISIPQCQLNAKQSIVSSFIRILLLDSGSRFVEYVRLPEKCVFKFQNGGSWKKSFVNNFYLCKVLR